MRNLVCGIILRDPSHHVGGIELGMQQQINVHLIFFAQAPFHTAMEILTNYREP